jgi:hypothetical protein
LTGRLAAGGGSDDDGTRHGRVALIDKKARVAGILSANMLLDPRQPFAAHPSFPQRRGRKLNRLLRIFFLGAGLVFIAPGGGLQAAGEEPGERLKEESHRKSGDEFFNGPIVSLEIEFRPEELEKLKHDARNYAEAVLNEGGKSYKVALKLKGAAGSFQGVDGKPGLTISFDKLKGSERFHGLKKFHLNNGVQDGTYLNEQIGGAMGRHAGVPASRCTHAFVKFNGRDLGLYVVKEAFTKDFLSYFFKDPKGDLWDGGFCKEIEENMEKDQGDPKDKTALKELIAACQEADPAKRWERLGRILDIDRFVSFTVMEDFLAHWDGYNFNRNNYRVYQDPQTGRLSFFLHGMDQLFGDANFGVMRDFPSLVGGAVMRCPEGAKLYRERALSIYENVLKGIDWPARVTEEGNRVREAIAVKNPQWAKEYQGRIGEARARVEQRIAGIGKQLGDLPKPAEFDKDNTLKLAGGWNQQVGDGGPALDEAQVDGKKCLHIRAPGPAVASWRKPVTLPAGKYRFEARLRTAGITAGGEAKGAALRISGGTAQQFAEGDSPWKPLSYEFESSGAPIVLVAELRAQKGEVWFEADSLRLLWMK